LRNVSLQALQNVIIDLEHALYSKVVKGFASAPILVHELKVETINHYGRGLIVPIVLDELALFFLCLFRREELFHPLCFVLTA
jgi:hypothetical protein